jgi:hypothetical protein
MAVVSCRKTNHNDATTAIVMGAIMRELVVRGRAFPTAQVCCYSIFVFFKRK